MAFIVPPLGHNKASPQHAAQAEDIKQHARQVEAQICNIPIPRVLLKTGFASSMLTEN
jgi:hypothetical protein